MASEAPRSWVAELIDRETAARNATTDEELGLLFPSYWEAVHREIDGSMIDFFNDKRVRDIVQWDKPPRVGMVKPHRPGFDATIGFPSRRPPVDLVTRMFVQTGGNEPYIHAELSLAQSKLWTASIRIRVIEGVIVGHRVVVSSHHDSFSGRWLASEKTAAHLFAEDVARIIVSPLMTALLWPRI